jgi:flagellar biosynthesis/type III secretory pathway chaperone
MNENHQALQLQYFAQTIRELITVLDKETLNIQNGTLKEIEKTLEQKRMALQKFGQQRSILLEDLASKTIVITPDDQEILSALSKQLGDTVEKNHLQLAKEILFRQELIEIAAAMLQSNTYGGYTKNGTINTQGGKQNPCFITLNDKV